MAPKRSAARSRRNRQVARFLFASTAAINRFIVIHQRLAASTALTATTLSQRMFWTPQAVHRRRVPRFTPSIMRGDGESSRSLSALTSLFRLGSASDLKGAYNVIMGLKEFYHWAVETYGKRCDCILTTKELPVAGDS